YDDIKAIKSMQSMGKLLQEIIESRATKEEITKNLQPLQQMIQALQAFEPTVLLHGKKQIYWDEDSYIHIAMRHLRSLQLGKSKEKTPFSYKPADTKSLLEQVLRQ